MPLISLSESEMKNIGRLAHDLSDFMMKLEQEGRYSPTEIYFALRLTTTSQKATMDINGFKVSELVHAEVNYDRLTAQVIAEKKRDVL